MLVLSRKESEKIKLGDDIVLTIVRVSGDRVRLGIDAPPELLILREELDPTNTERNKTDSTLTTVDIKSNSQERAA